MKRISLSIATNLSIALVAVTALADDPPALPKAESGPRTDVVTSPNTKSESDDEEETVTVNLEANHPDATLYHLAARGTVVGRTSYGSFAAGVEQWNPVCTAPCNKDVAANGTYRILGHGVIPSDEFRLPPGEKEVKLKSETGSSFLRGLGSGLGWLGGTAVIGGVTTFAIGQAAEDPYSREMSSLPKVGLAVAIGGAVTLAAGIVLIATNGSHVKTGTGRELAKTKSSSPKLTSSGLVF